MMSRSMKLLTMLFFVLPVFAQNIPISVAGGSWSQITIQQGTTDLYGYTYGTLAIQSTFQGVQGAGLVENSATFGAYNVPSNSTVYQANAVSGYIINNSATVQAVGGYFQAINDAQNGHSFGDNPVCKTTASITGQICTGEEVDVNASNTYDAVTGINVTGFWYAQAVNAPGVAVSQPGQGGACSNCIWAESFISNAGASTYALVAGATASSGTSLGSQPVAYAGVDSSGNNTLTSEAVDDNGLPHTAIGRTANPGAQIAPPSCTHLIAGSEYVVLDSTGPTYHSTYTSGGTIPTRIICSYTGSAYAWLNE